MSSTDSQFLARADDHPSEAIRDQVAALFRDHYAGLVGFAVRYVNSVEVAEEVVQEVFLRVWSQCENEGDASAVTRAYLYSAARNQAVTLLRHEQIVRRHAAAASVVPRDQTGDGTLPDAALEMDDLSRAVRRAIARLPERSRLVFLLSRERKLSYAEIAEVLGITVKAVEANMARALRALRASLFG